MGTIKVNTTALRTYASRLNSVSRRMDNVNTRVRRLYTLTLAPPLFPVINAIGIGTLKWKLSSAQNYLINTANDFENIERSLCNQNPTQFNVLKARLDQFIGAKDYNNGIMTEVEKKKKGNSLWSWSDTWKVVGEFGIFGSIVSTIGGVATGGKTWKDNFNVLKGGAKIIEKIAKAVPSSSNPTFDWKTLIGFNKVIKPGETPKNFWDAIDESLNKLKIGNAKTTSEKIAVGAKWAGYALTAITTVYENFTDTQENNSTARKIAESVGETAVKIGEGIAIGAAVTAAFAAAGVAAPAVVVGVVTVGVTWAIDKGFEALTGKNAAETISDFYLDSMKRKIDYLGNAAKTVTGTIGGWWKKAFG